MAKKTVGIISPSSATRALRHRLPPVLQELNKKIRRGQRLFNCTDYTDGMFPLVVAAFRKVKGWEVIPNNYGSIRIRLPGEAIF